MAKLVLKQSVKAHGPLVYPCGALLLGVVRCASVKMTCNSKRMVAERNGLNFGLRKLRHKYGTFDFVVFFNVILASFWCNCVKIAINLTNVRRRSEAERMLVLGGWGGGTSMWYC